MPLLDVAPCLPTFETPASAIVPIPWHVARKERGTPQDDAEPTRHGSVVRRVDNIVEGSD